MTKKLEKAIKDVLLNEGVGDFGDSIVSTTLLTKLSEAFTEHQRGKGVELRTLPRSGRH